jgi:hypothetical protein
MPELNKTLPFVVRKTTREDVEKFIETNHYSHSINGVRDSYCFKLLRDGEIIGAALFGGTAMANNWKKFAAFENEVIELRRLCCIDDTPKNTESYFIARCLRWISQNTDVKTVISYADPNHGHIGIIYKATNFQPLGKSPKGKMIKYEGRYYHDKSIRTYYNGKLKPFAQKLKSALESGEAQYIECEGKFGYLFSLKGSRKRTNQMVII